MTFLLALTVTQNIYLYISIAASVMLLVQFALTMFGIGEHGDFDADADFDDVVGDIHSGDAEFDADGGFRLLTFRGILSFLTAGGWTGFALAMGGAHPAVTSSVSVVVGLVAFVGVAILFKLVLKLQYDGTMSLKNGVGKIAEVYLPIGANSSKVGKITLDIQGSHTEAEAITLGDKDFPVGTYVKVSGMQNETIFIVEEINKENKENKDPAEVSEQAQ